MRHKPWSASYRRCARVASIMKARWMRQFTIHIVSRYGAGTWITYRGVEAHHFATVQHARMARLNAKTGEACQ
jgi:hypothetical protein